MRIVMLPHPKWFRSSESGIKQVCSAYARYFPKYDIHLVDENAEADLIAVHAGEAKYCDVLHGHGLYWTADYSAASWEWATNAQVVDLIRMAKAITVPSEWVAQTIRRDTKRNPYVIGHGIEWDEWQHEEDMGDFVLWNKNRTGDVCDPRPMQELAKLAPKIHFVTTFAIDPHPDNVSEPMGVIPHEHMKKLIQSAMVYLSTTKETFGIGILEAMAAGTPVLGFAHGGILDLVKHGVNGYLAQPGNIEDLAEGLRYCLGNRAVLGANGREMARAFTWEKAVEKVAGVYRETVRKMGKPHDVSVVIPSYKYADKVGRAIESVLAQTYPAAKIVVVDDGSQDDGATRRVVEKYEGVEYVWQPNAGVANARNNGVAHTDTRYVACLDADDAMAPLFLERCVKALQKDSSLGIAYTGLQYVLPDGKTGISKWPGKWDFDAQLQRKNQVPTLCVMRRDMFDQLGGYQPRYCPAGAGSEDAEFWTRCGAYGWKAEKVTEEGLFIYSWQSGRVSGDKNYKEPDWLAWHPWATDKQHPLASYAKPSRWSHPVRQYDEPVVSVIIPVGKGHEKDVRNALDSLEAQSFRKWEVIVVNDVGQDIDLTPYPYVHIISTEGGKGAGHARNAGAKAAKAPLLLWLDADDWLYPEALASMLRYWEIQEACIYTDFVGKAQVDDVKRLAPNLQKNILWRDEKTNETVIRYELPEYNWEKAQRQPEAEPWIWCNVTTLTPKRWHDEIGGFDESMPAWEDVDYWYRMAFTGKPFIRVPEPLLVYLFYSGNRRDTGYKSHNDLLAYLRHKYQEVKKMPCSGCGGRRAVQPIIQRAPVAPAAPPPISGTPTPVMKVRPGSPGQATIADDDFVLVDYIHPNRGEHRLIGHAIFSNRIPGMNVVNAPGGYRMDYGYRAGGQRFLVHRRDLDLSPNLFAQVPIIHQEEPQRDTPPPQLIVEPIEVPFQTEEVVIDVSVNAPVPPVLPDEKLTAFSLQKIPGLGSNLAEDLADDGIATLQQLIAIGEEGLQRYRGIGPARAGAIMESVRKMAEGTP